MSNKTQNVCRTFLQMFCITHFRFIPRPKSCLFTSAAQSPLLWSVVEIVVRQIHRTYRRQWTWGFGLPIRWAHRFTAVGLADSTRRTIRSWARNNQPTTTAATAAAADDDDDAARRPLQSERWLASHRWRHTTRNSDVMPLCASTSLYLLYATNTILDQWPPTARV